MHEQRTGTPSPGIGLGDIYYVLFRHKWKIAIICAIGLIATMALPFLIPVSYQSEAKLFVRYILEKKSPAQINGGDVGMKLPEGTYMDPEIEILNSLDLAKQVAENVGPEILAKVGGGKDPNAAASLIRRGLRASAVNHTPVITLTFQHADPSIVQPVLSEVVNSYFKRHTDAHRAVGTPEDFRKKTEELRLRLIETENALRAAKTNAGIISFEDTKKSLSEQIAKIRLDIFAAEAEFAQRRAALEEMARLLKSPTPATNEAPAKAADEVPSEKVAEYRRITGLLESLVKQEIEYSLLYTPTNSLIRSKREQITAAEKSKSDLEKEHPGLLGMAVTSAKPAEAVSAVDLALERAKVSSIAYKIGTLTNQLAQIRSEAAAMDSVEGTLADLQRKKESDEGSYKYWSTSLEKSLLDEELGNGGISNIRPIEAPTPPYRAVSKLNKMMAMVLLGSIGVAIALAFFIELYLDPSIRRPSEIERQLRLPLFLSIPQLKLNGKARRLNGSPSFPLLNGAAAATHPPSPEEAQGAPSPEITAVGTRNTAVEPWDVRHSLRPFFETLRDRLISFFEAVNLTHKPKLVAVTSCGEGAGVTTAAAGLAACLSETGDGNVLLVEMNLQQGEAHHFHKGHLSCELDDVLDHAKRDSALVQENLYVVREGRKDEQLPQYLPKRFKHLVPKLRASDYDYIIFDMPPVTQISATPRLAGFMDMVFLVIESEKTDREVVKRATALLLESKSNLGIILNKSKAYVPKRFQQDL